MIGLLRVRIEANVDHVGDGFAANLHAGIRLELLDEGDGHLVHRVDLACLEGADHRIRVLVDGDPDRVEVRLRTVVARVALQKSGALLVIALDEEGAAADEFAFGLHVPLLELFAVVAEMLLEDVLGQDVERLEVGERIGHRGGVGDLERAVVDCLKARGVVDVARHQTGRDVGVLEDGVASPLRVFGCQWRAVRPLARLDLERVDLAVGRDRPRFGPVADELEVLVVLDERRVRLLKDDVGDLVRANEGIDAIRRVGVADAEDAAFLDGSGSVARAAVAGGGARRGRCSTTAGGENAEQGDGE